MPVEYAGFTLKPNGFFSSNIAMDLPPERNVHSKDNREGDCCSSSSLSAACCTK